MAIQTHRHQEEKRCPDAMFRLYRIRRPRTRTSENLVYGLGLGDFRVASFLWAIWLAVYTTGREVSPRQPKRPSAVRLCTEDDI